jgi:hypothetical protein
MRTSRVCKCRRARQLTLHAWQRLRVPFARCILVDFVSMLGEVTACSRILALMYYIRIQLRARTRQENEECFLSHLSSNRPLRLLKSGLQHRTRERPVSSAIKLNIRESHTLRARVSCCLSVVVPPIMLRWLMDPARRTTSKSSERRRTLSALSTKRHTVVRSGMGWFLAVIL